MAHAPWEQLCNDTGKSFIKAGEPISASLCFNQFKHTSILPSSWDARPPICYVYLLSLVLGYVLVWSVISQGNWFLREGYFPLGILHSLHCRSVTSDEQFLFACAEHTRGSPTWRRAVHSFPSCGFSHDEGRPGALVSSFSATLSPFPFSWLVVGIFLDPLSPRRQLFQDAFLCRVLAPAPCPTPALHQSKVMSLDPMLVLNSTLHPSICVWSRAPVRHHSLSPGGYRSSLKVAASDNSILSSSVAYFMFLF